ncbi:hypothetical protein PMAYCL1PPCAC_28914 [Pristionchus mayeri]|uniref:CUB domain-containing protein n=1 Tax=Pristionchus mayeri TaxID=1317129 RepID=A0AAN5DB46_9BILA|nr:hypothetical protein PMAYCL1PPCAC_28914 [Pristionchus mayeri]
MLLLLLFSLLGVSSAVCPPGYQQINGGDCFKLYTTQQTYDNAETQCVQDGGHLASVHSPNEQNGLTAIMGATTPLIGMRCTDGTASHCTWSDGSAVDYSNFPGTGPIIAYGSCVHLASNDNSWYSWNCAAPISGFLCRVSLNAPVTTCTGGYVAYNGGCAALKTTVRTQSDAEAACSLDGGHLASIHSDTDNTFYSQLASNAGLTSTIYIGLAWNTAGNSYKWTDDTQYDYKKFANQFPNTVFGECVQMMLSTEFGSLGQWTNIPCSTPMAYVCWKASGETPAKAPAQCPGIQFFYDQGTVYSPNFPLSIPTGQTCEYVLATAVGTKVSVTFPIFSTDAGSVLSLYDGLDDVIPKTKLSGNAINPQQTYESATNVMKMIFTPSATPTGQGWQADFVSTGGIVTDEPTFDPSMCPEQQYTADTYVMSPNWPESYPPLSDCLYYIHSKDNRKMSIEFGYMDTEQCCDYVIVYDGPNNKSPVLATVSGQSDVDVKQYFSTGTTLTLEFFSDSNNEGHGWIATIRNI